MCAHFYQNPRPLEKPVLEKRLRNYHDKRELAFMLAASGVSVTGQEEKHK
jgi:hypothetical protein